MLAKEHGGQIAEHSLDWIVFAPGDSSKMGTDEVLSEGKAAS